MKTQRIIPIAILVVVGSLMFASQVPMMFGGYIEGGGGGSPPNWEIGYAGADPPMEVTVNKYTGLMTMFYDSDDTTWDTLCYVKNTWTAPQDGDVKIKLFLSYSIYVSSSNVQLRFMVKFYDPDDFYGTGWDEIFYLTYGNAYETGRYHYIHDGYFIDEFHVTEGNTYEILARLHCWVIQGGVIHKYGDSNYPGKVTAYYFDPYYV